MTDTYQSPGERLKEERERQKLTERDAANKLHLSMNYLRALEADDYDRLPEPTFVKGYLRNYARLLGLSAEELVAGFEALRTPQQLMQEMPAPAVVPTTSRRKAVTGIVCVAVLVLIVGWWLSARESTERVDGDDVTESRLPPAAPTTTPAAAATASAPLAVAGQVAASAPIAAMMPIAPAAPAASGNLAMMPQTVATPTAVAVKASSLLIKFSAPCWVEVVDASGKDLFKGNRTADTQLQLRGVAPFHLMFGNAAGVASVDVDGKAVALPQSPAGDVAHLQAP